MHQELTDSLVRSPKIEIMEWVQRTPLFGVHVTEKNVGVLGLMHLSFVNLWIKFATSYFQKFSFFTWFFVFKTRTFGAVSYTYFKYAWFVVFFFAFQVMNSTGNQEVFLFQATYLFPMQCIQVNSEKNSTHFMTLKWSRIPWTDHWNIFNKINLFTCPLDIYLICINHVKL